MENFDQLDLWNKEPEFTREEFRVAREFARNLKLRSEEEWMAYAGGNGTESGNGAELEERNIPRNPDKVYRNHGWKGWGDWLGGGSSGKADLLWSGEARD